MYKKNIAAIFILVFVLGLFFQYNRSDGFVRLSKNVNENVLNAAVNGQMQDKASLPKEKFLVVYDPANVSSMFMKHNLEKIITDQKKDVVTMPVHAAEAFSQEYTGVLLTTGDMQKIPGIAALEQYVEQGGTAIFLQRLSREAMNAGLQKQLGIETIGSEVNTNGIEMKTDFLFGASDFSMDEADYQTAANQVDLAEKAEVQMTSADGLPLLWQTASGDGKYIVYNGTGMTDKMNYGLIVAAMSCTEDTYVYPVLGMKLFFIDDFPAPEPEGNYDKIYDELHLTTVQFFREVWWPKMLSNAKKYDLKYTGLVIESYGDQVKGPFKPLPGRKSKDNLIVYGRELLKAGGELGLHGYNHQSLAPAGYNQDALGYVPWKSEEDMTESMQELRRYVKEVFPDYEFRTYVPPSNILSPEGKAAVKKAFPELKVYASLYNGVAEEHAYYQDFQKNADGTFEIPRVTSGYIPSDSMKWEGINVLNMMGVFSHFVHPDELFYEESKDLTWDQMEHGLRDFLADIFGRYPWLRSATASEAMEYMDDYADLNYRVHRSPDHTTVQVWNYRKPVTFILRSDKELDHANGCKVEWIDDGAYLVRVEDTTAEIYWKGEKD